MNEQTLRQVFKYFNRLMILMWRLGMGQLINFWPQVIGRIMVITHTGRKTGLRRHTPVNYAIVDGDVYCVVGFGPGSDWYRNIQASPQVEVWLPEGWWSGEAHLSEEVENRSSIMRQILINSGFAAPLFAGIYAGKISDSELEMITRSYKLVRIRRVLPCTGSGGPADLVWVWPTLAHVFLAGWIIKKIFLRRIVRRIVR